MNKVNNGIRIILTGITVLASCTACNSEWLKRAGYESSNHYVCQEQGPNLPEQVRKCREAKMSYEEYQEARTEVLSNE